MVNGIVIGNRIEPLAINKSLQKLNYNYLVNDKFSIGGEFTNFNNFISKKKNNNLIFMRTGTFTLSGRSAFSLILNKLNKHKDKIIYLPAYICNTLVDIVKKLKIKYQFYDTDLISNLDKKFKLNSIILIIHYFGVNNQLLKKINKKNFHIIEDHTHNFLNRDFKKIEKSKNHIFFSFRKFSGLIYGGWCNHILIQNRVANKLIIKKESNFSKIIDEKNLYFNDNDKTVSDSAEKKFLNLNQKIDLFLTKYANNYNITKKSLSNLKYYNWNEVFNVRRKNWLFLKNSLKDKFNFYPNKLKAKTCPIYFIIISDRRNELRNMLISKRIFIPLLWDNNITKSSKKFPKSNLLYKKVLPIPIDQRYSDFHMNIITQTLLNNV